MKRLFFVILCCLILLATTSMASTISIIDSTDVQEKSITPSAAIEIYKLTYNHNSLVRKKVYQILLKMAKGGNAEAMHYMGMINYSGLSGTRNLDYARKWFELADTKGYAKSAYNLGIMYKTGTGVIQSLAKAYNYIQRGCATGDAQAVYMRGYMLYKGLGCAQSYEGSVKCFKEASQNGNGYAMYMLGLCYRNGYGVPRDNPEANYWLKKAADTGIKWASEELNTDTPENVLKATKIRAASLNSSNLPDRFQAVKHQLTPQSSIQGYYIGRLMTYDWSGQHIIKESPLQMNIEQSANEITVRWQEDSLAIIEAKGMLTDTALIFTRAVYSKKDHYHVSAPQTLNFVKAYLKTVQKGDTILLAGSLQFYSPISKEPEKPMYLSVQLNQKQSTFITDIKKEPIAYPNPSSGQLTVSFYLEREAVCSISISMINGITLYQEPLGKLASGMQRFQMQLDLPPASYLLKLNYGEKVYKTIVIKQNNQY